MVVPFTLPEVKKKQRVGGGNNFLIFYLTSGRSDHFHDFQGDATEVGVGSTLE